MQSVRAIGLLAGACALIAAGAADLRAATDDELGKAETKKSSDPKDIRVIIPSYSRDVDDNGCRRRSSPQERFSETDADIKHVRFEDLISEVIGRYSTRRARQAGNVHGVSGAARWRYAHARAVGCAARRPRSRWATHVLLHACRRVRPDYRRCPQGCGDRARARRVQAGDGVVRSRLLSMKRRAQSISHIRRSTRR